MFGEECSTMVEANYCQCNDESEHGGAGISVEECNNEHYTAK